MINTIKVNQCQPRKTSSNDNNLQFIDCPKNLSSDESLVLNIIKGIIKSGGDINVPIRHETISSRSKFGKTKVKEIINKLNSLVYLNRKQGFNLGYKCKKGRDNTWYYSAPEQNVILISTRINTGLVKFRPTRSKNKETIKKENIILFERIEEVHILQAKNLSGKTIHQVREHNYRFYDWRCKTGFKIYDPVIQLVEWIWQSQQRKVTKTPQFIRNVAKRKKNYKEMRFMVKANDNYLQTQQGSPPPMYSPGWIEWFIASKFSLDELNIFKARVHAYIYDEDNKTILFLTFLNNELNRTSQDQYRKFMLEDLNGWVIKFSVAEYEQKVTAKKLGWKVGGSIFSINIKDITDAGNT